MTAFGQLLEVRKKNKEKDDKNLFEEGAQNKIALQVG